MSDGQKGPDEGSARWLPLIRFVPVVGAVLVLLAAWAGSYFNSDRSPWDQLLFFGAAVVIAFLVGATLRFAIAPAVRPPHCGIARLLTLGDTARDRLAPLVLLFGGVGIVILSLAVIIALAVIAAREGTLRAKFDTVLMTIFTAVLPVFATWVGTVIAFYFSNESFRSAAQAAREAAQPPPEAPTVDSVMIPYDRIGRMEVGSLDDAKKLKVADVASRLNQQTTRVLVFQTGSRRPLLIIRRSLMPPEWLSEDLRPPALATTAVGGDARSRQRNAKKLEEATVADYLQLPNDQTGTNEADATRFAFVALATKLDDARQAMVAANARDVFVTARGTREEPVIGWVPDDRLTTSGPAKSI